MIPDPRTANLRLEMREARALVFDLDGTLADTFEDLTQAVNHVRALRGLSLLSTSDVRREVGHGARVLMRRCAAPKGTEDEEAALREFLAFYSRHLLDRTRPYPGVVEALTALQGLPMAVLSNKPQAQTRTIVEGLGLSAFFQGVFGGDSFAAMKPDPIAVRAVLSFLGTPAQHTWMIGDSEVDVQAARRAGMRVVLVTTGLVDEVEAEALRPDLVVTSLLDLIER